jgi:hypothetical protein
VRAWQASISARATLLFCRSKPKESTARRSRLPPLQIENRSASFRAWTVSFLFLSRKRDDRLFINKQAPLLCHERPALMISLYPTIRERQLLQGRHLCTDASGKKGLSSETKRPGLIPVMSPTHPQKTHWFIP